MILLISAVFPPEPVVSASLGFDIAKSLSKKWNVKVLTPRPTRPMGFSFNDIAPKSQRFEQIILNSFTCPNSRLFGRMRESYSFGKHAVEYIKLNYKDIECIYINSWPLFAQYLIIKKSIKYSIPVTTHVQDIYPESLLRMVPIFKRFVYKLLIPLDKFSLQHSSKVITISLNMKNHLLKTRELNENNVEVVYNWQDDEKFISDLGSSNQKLNSKLFTFMFLGSLSPSAAIEIIIMAFGLSKIKKSRLVIAGNGSERDSLVALTKKYTDVNIEFWDAPKIKVPEIQHSADVLILGLKKGVDGFALPSKLSTYMLSKKPILGCVNKESDTANVIMTANCGWITPPEDIESLSESMKRVVTLHKEELQIYGENGFNYAQDNFSQQNNLQKLTSIIIKTINS